MSLTDIDTETDTEEDDSTYDHDAVEEKWQERWEEEGVFEADDEGDDKYYVLGMFPYPSGKLHMGHVRNYSITDAYARYRRMKGHEVLHPMGWDSFGLPAENAALERDTNPRDWTIDCIDSMHDQMEAMGFGYDWSREIKTSDPDYFRWNQWLFKRFYDEGLVENKEGEVNWCPSCETVLANEQVEDDRCWRCETPVETRMLDQWYFEITEYADELLEYLEELDGWPDSVTEMQRNWIGKQEGARVDFEVEGYGDVEVFTTRLDTIHGATYMALAPEHPVAEDIADGNDDVADFIDSVDEDREVGPDAEKNGVFTGEYAVNPATGDEIPVYVADFVMMDFGTGAIMAVPAHDERDHEFAEKYDIEIRQVVEPEDGDVDAEDEVFTEDGVLVNSGGYDGVESEEARKAIAEDLDAAEEDTEYRLRDWLISRQRYWGTPIPVVHCEDCGEVLVSDEELPVELPEFVQSTGNPLEEVDGFVETECPECGGEARRETDTMDTFVDSSWYFLRYTSPDYDDAPFDVETANDWMPVDQYVGGIEHAVMHLLYSRFFTHVLNDTDLVDVKEPFENLVTQGMVLLEGEKMSKSKGNVVSPQRIVDDYGADTARLFTMGAALPEKDFDWTEKGVKSNYAFIERLHTLVSNFTDYAEDEDDALTRDGAAEKYVEAETDATVETASDEYENFEFNHAVRDVKNLVSLLEQYSEYRNGEPDPEVFRRGLETAVKVLAPITPHVSEEMWDELGGEGLVAEADWPSAEVPDDYALEERLIENTREDVREISEVAGIEDPEEIRIITAPGWKYDALQIALDLDSDADVIGRIMSEDEIRRHGDAAASYGQYLQKNQMKLEDELPPEREAEALERARWLFVKEFDAEIRIQNADESDSERADKARPGKPAIEIE
ncbi:leucine--tRNA ligase [Halorutilales archaeon Cl-col2-1]